MSLTSVGFLGFLLICFILHWSVPVRSRNLLLLVFSYGFYMSAGPVYALLLLYISLLSFYGALYGRRYIKVLILLLLLPLIGFKYLSFFNENLAVLLHTVHVNYSPVLLQLILPAGISFYTFQAIAYVTDVARGDAEAETHLPAFLLYMSFFPYVLSGPIPRAKDLLTQIRATRTFDADTAIRGLQYMAIGFFKKIALADPMAIEVGRIYGALRAHTGFSLILASLLFTLQIYCDFSGYTDIATGCGLLFGIRLPVNFRQAYFATSLQDFWSRWHISLSTWFRDYVYIPLGGSRVGVWRKYLNLLVTFLLSGLWHGASWTFVFWGGMHGLGRILEDGISSLRNPQGTHKRISRLLRGILTFCFVSAAWVFFRAATVSDALYVFRHAPDGITHPLLWIKSGIGSVYEKKNLLVCLPVFLLLEVAGAGDDLLERIQRRSVPVRYCIFTGLLLLTWYMLPIVRNLNFLYFQF